MSSPRANRVPGRIKEILAGLITTLKDPRIGFVTVTDVRMTSDFSKATVFYTVLGKPSEKSTPDDTKEHRAAVSDPVDAVVNDPEGEARAQARTAEGLASAKPLLRRELGSRMRLRQVPALEFVLDPVPAQGRRIEALLDEARTQQ